MIGNGRRTLALSSAALALGATAAAAQVADATPPGTYESALRLIVLVGALALIPALTIMATCFPLIVTVFSILRQGIGLQSAPPNMLLVGLATILTLFAMEPVLLTAWDDGAWPFLDGRMEAETALPAIVAPFEAFMETRTDEDTLAQMEALRSATDRGGPSFATLAAAFMLSEMERAFQIGFLVFLPFIIIDLVVAAVLMSMGMMMVPPSLVALPFKLAFFVAVDGWTLIAQSLVVSYI